MAVVISNLLIRKREDSNYRVERMGGVYSNCGFMAFPLLAMVLGDVDGEEVEITPIGDAMLAFKLSAGTHTVDLKYSPEGFKMGVIVTVLGLLIFILMIVAVWQKKRLLPVWNKVTAKAKGLLPAPKKAPASAVPDATAVAEQDDAPDEPDEDTAPTDTDDAESADETTDPDDSPDADSVT